jgi:sigma-B regulation protein RsbU (phosphoserine phosphatase)
VIAGKIKFEHAAMELIAQAQLKTEIDMAAKIQLRLLPQSFPSVSGLQIFARSNPAAQVGGDFYDFVAHQQRPFIFSVGDVSGKGMSAALFMAMTRILLHASSRSIPNVTPTGVIGRVNEDLYDDFSEAGMFATVFVGAYQLDEKQVIYTNAGHSPVIYLAAGTHAIAYDSHRLPFQAGDLLVIGTDGLAECMNADGEMFGYERLLSLVEETAHLPAAHIGTTIFDRVNHFTQGYNQFDDQTLVVIKGVSS